MSIEQHKFSDGEVTIELNEDGTIWICATAYSSLNKRDVIALAKHFKLTSNDIRSNENNQS